jgi:hypothetical protein
MRCIIKVYMTNLQEIHIHTTHLLFDGMKIDI